MLAPWQKSYDKPRQCIKKQRHHFADRGPHSQSYGFFQQSCAGICDLNHKEGWALKNWFFWIVVLEKTPESPVDCKEIKSVNPKENQLWIFTERTDAEAPILWPPDVTHWKRLWWWEGLRAGREGDDRERDGWMASPTQWSLSKLWGLVMDR